MKHGALLDLPFDLQKRVVAEIDDGERVVWARQPIPRWFTLDAFGPVLIGLVIAGILTPAVLAIFFGVGHVTNEDGQIVDASGPRGLVPKVVILVFVALAAFLLATPYLAWRARRATVYAVTDRRALVVRRSATGRTIVHRFAPDRVAQMTTSARRDGSGDLVFEVITTTSGSSTSTERRGFLGVADVCGVEEMLRKTLLAGRTRAA